MSGYLKKAMIWIQSQQHYKHKGNIKEQKLKTAWTQGVRPTLKTNRNILFFQLIAWHIENTSIYGRFTEK